jgi:ubiquinol-cytochrome c reductase cytochrome c subunit
MRFEPQIDTIRRGARRLLLPLAGGILVLLLIAIVARAQPPSGVVHPPGEPGKPQLLLGAELFAANCASCHGIDGRGVSPSNPVRGAGDIEGAGPSLQGAGALAADFYLRTGRMPLGSPGEQPERSRPEFSETEIRALTSYVASLGKGPPIPTPEPDQSRISRGMELFTENCAGCHQIVGEGGYVTDARVPVLQHASATEIAEAVRIGPYLMPSFSRRTLNDRQLNAIIAYIEQSKSPDDRGGIGLGHIGPVPEGMVAWLVGAVVLVGVCLLIGERARRA